MKQLREEAKLTQEQLAYELGISSSTLRRWEKGTEPAMTKQQWDKFCQAVGRRFEELPQNLVMHG